jgi:hypothetical protein
MSEVKEHQGLQAKVEISSREANESNVPPASHTTTPCSGDDGNETVNSRPVKFEISPRMSKVSIIHPMENSV